MPSQWASRIHDKAPKVKIPGNSRPGAPRGAPTSLTQALVRPVCPECRCVWFVPSLASNGFAKVEISRRFAGPQAYAAAGPAPAAGDGPAEKMTQRPEPVRLEQG